MYKITFQQIHSFLALAKTLNFTDTAESLYLSQPALSKQMNVLEEELGFPLFARNKRSVHLTPEGEVLFKDWSVLEQMLHSSISNAKMLKLTTTGKIRVGCTDTFHLDPDLPGVIASFSERYPLIDIDLESYGFRTLRDMFHNHDLDLVFLPEFEAENYKDADHLFFKKVELCIAVPASHAFFNRESLDISDLRGEPLITISPKESTSGVNKIKEYCRRFHFEANIVKYVNNLNSLILGVKNGIGITICDSCINDPKIKTFPLKVQPGDSDILAVWHKEQTQPEVALFLEEILEKIQEDEG